MKTLKDVDLQFVSGGFASETIGRCTLTGSLVGACIGLYVDIENKCPLYYTTVIGLAGSVVGAKVGIFLELANSFEKNNDPVDALLMGYLIAQ